MQEVIKFIIAILVLILGFPIGAFLARQTKEELRRGQMWFKTVIILCFIGAVLSLFFRNDVFLFTFLFIGIVTSGSLIVPGKRKKRIKR
jgi:formate hydrogenlyase subunit 3/multisubunit Na+/H+ antiporter MnhD subunit